MHTGAIDHDADHFHLCCLHAETSYVYICTSLSSYLTPLHTHTHTIYRHYSFNL